MRYLRYGFLAALAVVLVVLALANRDTITLNLLPGELSGFLGLSWSMELPLFVVIFGAIIAGICIGFIWEWFREYRQRAEAARARRERDRLARELTRLREPSAETGDDVLALVE